MTQKRTTRSKLHPPRERRRKVAGHNKLTVDEAFKEPGYTYRWVNDGDDFQRVAEMRSNDWDTVSVDADQQVIVGDPGAGDASQVGTVVRRPVGRGMHAVLMKKYEAWHQEDLQAEQAQLDEQERMIMNDPSAQNPEGLQSADVTREDAAQSLVPENADNHRIIKN